MIKSKLVLASFIAFAILAMATTTMVTQEVYAKHTQPKILNLVHAKVWRLLWYELRQLPFWSRERFS
jgi:hypothetical protein